MSDQNANGLVTKYGLGEADLAAIEQLAAVCDKHDQASMRLNWGSLRRRPSDEANDFLYYQDGALVGALALYAFGPSEAETSGMVHPSYRRRGIFRELVDAAVAELRRRGTPKLIFFCDHQSQAARPALEALGAQYGYSEHKMLLRDARLPAAFDPDLRFGQAESADLKDVVRIIANAFGMNEADMLAEAEKNSSSGKHQYYIGKLGGTPIGALSMQINGGQAGIYGFGVWPEYRGRGYGRQILARAIQAALAAGATSVILEVAPENDRALGLYQSVGFEETNRYDYYIRML